MAAKELTLREHCLEELLRLKNTYGFPDGKKALNDYCNALLVMETFDGITSLMNDLTQTEMIRMPSAASLRAMAYDRMASVTAARRACAACDGVGSVTQWRLVTYRGHSFAIEKIEALPLVTNYEQARDFAEVLAKAQAENPQLPRQVVLSAAKDCACRARVIA